MQGEKDTLHRFPIYLEGKKKKERKGHVDAWWTWKKIDLNAARIVKRERKGTGLTAAR